MHFIELASSTEQNTALSNRVAELEAEIKQLQSANNIQKASIACQTLPMPLSAAGGPAPPRGPRGQTRLRFLSIFIALFL
jgi:hypothetical protein